MTRLSRRDFIRVGALTTAATISAACVPAAPATVPPEAPPEAPTTGVPEVVSKYREAPMLADLVAKGELPPVEERLPETPYVSPVLESIGVYGGTWRWPFRATGATSAISRPTQRGPLGLTGEVSLRPEICESWDVNDDGSAWTFHLRPGHKWSDGMPLTTGDVNWYWDHVVLNETLTPVPPSKWSTGDPNVLAQLETPDDFTFTLKFAHPKPLFPYEMLWLGQIWSPGHYMAQFHPDFTPVDDLKTLAEDQGFSTWEQLYANRDANQTNPERPCLDVWVAKTALPADVFESERNPYCHQVDPEGQQLPYIDRMRYRYYDTPDVKIMWLLSGEVDMAEWEGNVGVENYTLFKDEEDDAPWEVVKGGASIGHQAIVPNHACKDTRLRSLIQNRDFRIAWSLAMNRDEMNELVFDGMAFPCQFGPLPTDPQFYPKLSNAYIEYDPDEANRLLDEAGYVERDAEGFRTFNDGSGDTISLIIEGCSQPGSTSEDIVLMCTSYLADVGIQATYKFEERSLFTERWLANDVVVGNWGMGRCVLPVVDYVEWMGLDTLKMWPGAWALWKLDPSDPNGEPPPEDHFVREIWRIYFEEVAVELDEQARYKAFEKIMDIYAEELPHVNFLRQPDDVVVKPRTMHNYTKPLGLTHKFGTWSTIWAQQVFWEDPENHL